MKRLSFLSLALLCQMPDLFADQIALWTFDSLSGIVSGSVVNATVEAASGTPTVVILNQTIDGNGKDGTTYTDSNGILRSATRAIAWDDFRGSGTDGELKINIDTSGFENLTLRFDIKENDNPLDSSIREFDLHYSTDGINFSLVSNLTVINNATFQSKTINLSSISAIEDAAGIVLRLSQGGESDADALNDSVSFDNIELTGTAIGPDPNAPVLSVAGTTTPRIDLATLNGGVLSGVINDPTDPAASRGVDFLITDADQPAGPFTVTAASSNTGVVPNANLALAGVGASRNLKITPTGVGTATITVTITDPSAKQDTYTIDYAASAATSTPRNSRYHTGASDASTAIEIDDQLLVANDEDQVLRTYTRRTSGLPAQATDLNTSLSLAKEADLEASFRDGNRVYWLGSHGNDRSGDIEPTRHISFSTDVASGTPVFVNDYTGMRADLIAWDNANGHGLGAGALGFDLGTDSGVTATDPNGFNIEGAALAANGHVYLGFRAPLKAAAPQSGDALVIPVTNFRPVVDSGTGPMTFGSPIFLDLGGRAIRSIADNGQGEFLILAGPVDNSPPSFEIFSWNGNPASSPILQPSTLNTIALESGGSPETIVGFDRPLANLSTVTVLIDNGGTIHYANGIESKDLVPNWQKFRSDIVELRPVPTVIAGGVEVVQNDAGNTPGSVSLSLAPGSSSSVNLIEFSSNRGDFVLDFPPADDPASGVLITTVSENGRDNSAAGDPAGTVYATSAVDIGGVGQTDYLIATFDAPGGTEFNINTAFAWFDFGQWLGGVARNSTNNGPIDSLTASTGIDLGVEFTDDPGTVGIYELDLTGLGASSTDGILLVNGAKNEDNYALSRSNLNGTFTLFCHDNGFNGGAYENDPVAFVYLPANAVGTGPLVALGRVNSNGSLDLAAGLFTIVKASTGTWHLTLPGHSPQTGTLLLSPEGGDNFNVDNSVSWQWDAANARYVIESRDLTGLALQNGGSPGEDMFSFAFVAGSPISVSIAADEDNGSADPDLGAGVSLREAVTYAPSGSVVTFDPSAAGRTINLSLGDIILDRNLVIDASLLPGGITIDAGGSSRIFRIPSGTVTLAGLTLAGGNASSSRGGAILIEQSGSLLLRDSTIRDNFSGDSGGGIANDGGDLEVLRSTFMRNGAGSNGGAIYSNTSLSSPVTILENTTLHQNQAANAGGGFYNFDGLSVLTHCTITDNAAAAGGGVASFGDASTLTQVNASIIRDNTATDMDFVSGTTNSFNSKDHNIAGKGNALAAFNNAGDQTGTASPIRLSPPGTFGGLTETRHPLAGSPAIDAAAAGLAIDQRGLPRDTTPDAGAVEVGPVILVDSRDDTLTATTLRQAIADATVPGTVIRFSNSRFDGVGDDRIEFSSRINVSDRTIFVDASDLISELTLDGVDATQLFFVDEGAVAAFHNIRFVRGKASTGGAVLNYGDATFASCEFLKNAATFGAAAVNYGNNRPARMILNGCLIENNQATANGAGILNWAQSAPARMQVIRSTVSNNAADSLAGGVYNYAFLAPALLDLRGSTVAGNRATEGAGVFTWSNGPVSALTSILHSTISGNHASVAGGGARNQTGSTGPATTSLHASILAGNTAPNGPDLSESTAASFQTFGGNVIGIANTIGGPAWLGSDQTGTTGSPLNARLSPLGYFGGEVLTIHPLDGSPALDAVTVNEPLSLADQRGFPRPIGSAPDAGAVEQGPLILVTSNDDTLTATTLRRAIADATAPGTVIRFDPVVFKGGAAGTNRNEILTTSALEVSGKSLFIDAFPVDGVTLDAGGNHAVIENIGGGGTVALRGFRITSGKAVNGGGLVNALDGSKMTVFDSAVFENIASNAGGGIFNGFDAAIAVINTSVFHNEAGSFSGGFENNSDRSTARIIHSTISRNRAPTIGGLGNNGATARVVLANSVIAQNSADIWPDINTGGPFTFTGPNLIGNNADSTARFPTGNPNADGNLAGSAFNPLDPKLTPPGDFGGPAYGFHPRALSPVIDTGALVGHATDQRGYRRTVAAAPDLGALEYGPITVVDDTDDGPSTATTLRKAITDAKPVPGSVIRFDPAVFPNVIKLTDDIPMNGNSVYIDASDIPGIVAISTAGLSRHFEIGGGSKGSVGIDSLRLIGGNATGGFFAGSGGSILASVSSVMLLECEISGNVTDSNGGAVWVLDGGRLDVHNSTISGNLSSADGGAISLLAPAMAVVENSTFSGNASNNNGGAIFARSGTRLILRHTTVTNNFGGSAIRSNTDITLENSIVAGNAGGDVSNSATTRFSGNNLTSGDPLLAPLGDYGGGVLTRPPLPGSPAIEGAVALVTSPPLDSRRAGRPGGPLPDLGAVEAVAFGPLPLASGDGDAIPDLLEGPAGPYPQLSSAIDDSLLDSDGDGQTDEDELNAMTNPLDANDRLQILTFVPSTGFDAETNPVFDVTVTTFPGLSYLLQPSTNLLNFGFFGGPVIAEDHVTTFTNVPVGTGPGFLRIRLNTSGF